MSYYNSESISQLRNRSQYSPDLSKLQQVPSTNTNNQTETESEQKEVPFSEPPSTNFSPPSTNFSSPQKSWRGGSTPSQVPSSRLKSTTSNPTPQQTNVHYKDENGIEYDQHGNILSEKCDLGKDGAFNDFSVLIGKFVNRGPLNDYFVGLAVKALEKKGFRVETADQENTFVDLLDNRNYDVAWIISGFDFQGTDRNKFKESVIRFHRSGKGLMIYGDNLPYYEHANIVLPDLVGCQLYGDTPAGKTLKYGHSNEVGYFDEKHLIFAGINNLYEGVTICYPDKESKLVTLATSSDNHPCILKCEARESLFEDGGRIVVDSGWTKLYQMYWASAGQARYVVNATVWLVNIEDRFGQGIEDFL